VPLTEFQSALAGQLAVNRTEDSDLAGGAAALVEPNTKRYSNDLDYFHDSEQRVAEAFAKDRAELENSGYSVSVEMNQPGYIRAVVGKGKQATKVEWARDSSWRFMPTVRHEQLGFVLHPIDLAINKVLRASRPRNGIELGPPAIAVWNLKLTSLTRSSILHETMGKRSKTFSTYEAKARFSELLRRVRDGDRIRISYHGRTVAEMRPVYDAGIDQALVELEEQGVLDRPTAPKGRLEPIAKKKGALRRFLETRE
jgi:antitoxin (DNA-binding transcriptional repressor) of toxin-antitoxin stability system